MKIIVIMFFFSFFILRHLPDTEFTNICMASSLFSSNSIINSGKGFNSDNLYIFLREEHRYM
jgi:hypothetical protein